MRKPLLMMRTRGLLGPVFGRFANLQNSLAKSIGNAISAGAINNPELISDPSFQDTAEWVKGAGWTVSNGANCSGVQASASDLLNSGGADTINGTTYTVKVNCSALSAGTFQISFGAVLGAVRSAAGSYEEEITAISTGAAFAIKADGDLICDITSFSVKEAP